MEQNSDELKTFEFICSSDEYDNISQTLQIIGHEITKINENKRKKEILFVINNLDQKQLEKIIKLPFIKRYNEPKYYIFDLI